MFRTSRLVGYVSSFRGGYGLFLTLAGSIWDGKKSSPKRLDSWSVGFSLLDDMLESSGQIITTSAEVTLNGGLIRELPQNPLNSGLGIILICPESCKVECKKIQKTTS